MNSLNLKSHSILVLILGLFLLGLAACTVRTPTVETPAPNDRGIEKTFFVEKVTTASANGTSATVLQPKTFLCGWAPISESGAIASSFLTHAVHMAGHCNMEFEITADALIGRLVNPTFPNDRTRWKPALIIPIRKHYYYELAKDSYGRDTNQFIENTSRSDFSARPMMDLALEGLSIDDWDLSMFWDSRNGKITSIQDVEWDKKSGFLGFTASVTSPTWGSAVAARIRFNFKAFEHNAKFEVTPYSPLNAKYFNALHVIGEKVEGINQIWSAAKWDLSKSHDVYLHGFPDAYVPLAQRTVDQWNEALKAIGKPAAFRLNRTPMKYPFDLRYPMIVWVDDPQISASSPLGVGMAQADVRNGEIIWGQVTVYGGMLERYVKSHLSASGSGTSSAQASSFSGSFSTAASVTSSPLHAKSLGSPAFFETYFNPTTPLKTVEPIGADGLLRLENRLASMLQGVTPDAKPTGQKEDRTDDAKAQALQSLTPLRADSLRAAVRTAYAASMSDIKIRQDQTSTLRTDPRRAYGFLGDASQTLRSKVFGRDESSMSPGQKLKALTTASADELRRSSSGVVHDADRRFLDVGPALLAGFAKSGVSYEQGLRNVIHELLLHEFGHMIGLGHQFKENILPVEGTVPKRFFEQLKKSAHNHTNASSVMGYRHPITELMTNFEDIAPGPQDLLTLRYLYKGEYATFERGSDATDFTFVKVPASGIIPSRNPDRPENATSYFPQCNDFDATFGADPYCNRFDRGTDAESIVKFYFEDLNANMVSKIYSFADVRGTNTDSAEGYLWWKSLAVLARVRTFYDHMRQKFEPEIRTISRSERDLFEFSRVCTGEIEGSRQLNAIFTSNPELKELCRVNRMAVREMKNLMTIPGPDSSRMDWDNAGVAASMTGGDADADYSRVFGTHTALSVLPLKLSAINALTTPYPYSMLGGWMFPIPRYSGSDGLFSYSTLYPVEFTQTLALGVEKNLRFGSIATDTTRIGLPILSMGYFVGQQAYGRDGGRMPKDFIETVRRQTNFRIAVKAVILKLKTRDDKTRVTHFEAELYDPGSNQSQKISEAFILPGGKLIVRPASRTFVYPLAEVMFVSDEMAFAWAYSIEYDDKEDSLASHSVKATLEKINTSVLDACIRGDNDGLASFFNSQEDPAKFKGFLVMKGIAGAKEKELSFLDSVRENFNRFYELKTDGSGRGPTPERCENARMGVGMIVATAALLNGYYLPEIVD